MTGNRSGPDNLPTLPRNVVRRRAESNVGAGANPHGKGEMPHVAELHYPGRWLDQEDHERSLRLESGFHQLERFLAEAAIALNHFEGCGAARLPELYQHLTPHVHARAFLAAMDDVGRSLGALESGEEAAPPMGMRVAADKSHRRHDLRAIP